MTTRERLKESLKASRSIIQNDWDTSYIATGRMLVVQEKEISEPDFKILFEEVKQELIEEGY